MPTCWTMWSKDLTVAVIQRGADYPDGDLPLNALNDTLGRFYNQEISQYCFVYEAHDPDGQSLGWMVTGTLQIPEDELEDLIFAKIFNDVVASEIAEPLGGDFNAIEWNV